MKFHLRAAAWLVLCASFAVLAYFYHSLPSEITIARSFFGGGNIVAPKSLFTVFRVPLIEVVCAAAIEIMRRKFAAQPKFSLMWSILLYTVALKSLFQSLETVSAENLAAVFLFFTIGVVALGIGAALFVGREFFSKSARSVWKLNYPEKAILTFLLVGYSGLAIVPILVYK